MKGKESSEIGSDVTRFAGQRKRKLVCLMSGLFFDLLKGRMSFHSYSVMGFICEEDFIVAIKQRIYLSQ